MADCRWVPSVFENALKNGFHPIGDCTSNSTVNYNCVAWAAGETSRPWWPVKTRPYFWPTAVAKNPASITMQHFLEAFSSLKYEQCGDSKLEAGFEKVAFFEKEGKPTHASRQLSTGAWTSKLGDNEDISHAYLEAVSGRKYGMATTFMKRPKKLANP